MDNAKGHESGWDPLGCIWARLKLAGICKAIRDELELNRLECGQGRSGTEAARWNELNCNKLVCTLASTGLLGMRKAKWVGLACHRLDGYGLKFTSQQLE